MFNYRVTLQFDGTDFCGWQMQSKEFRTVQGEMTRVVTMIAKRHTLVTGSSRTDAGVHAAGLVANFHLPFQIEEQSLQRALNSLLPREIRVAGCSRAEISFNARFHAVSKTYQYKLYFGQVLSPFKCRYVTHVPYPLDLAAMRRSLKYFIGEKDFTSFTSDEPEKKKIRSVDELTMRVKDQEVIFTVRGKSFLRYMVRNIVGTLIDVGKHKIAPRQIGEIFAAKNRRAAGQTAPPQGLTLLLVEYPPPQPAAPELNPKSIENGREPAGS